VYTKTVTFLSAGRQRPTNQLTNNHERKREKEEKEGGEKWIKESSVLKGAKDAWRNESADKREKGKKKGRNLS